MLQSFRRLWGSGYEETRVTEPAQQLLRTCGRELERRGELVAELRAMPSSAPAPRRGRRLTCSPRAACESGPSESVIGGAFDSEVCGGPFEAGRPLYASDIRR
jgi:hypothetical protein